MDEVEIAKRLIDLGKIKVILLTDELGTRCQLDKEESLAFLFSSFPAPGHLKFRNFKQLSENDIQKALFENGIFNAVKKTGIQATNYQVIRFLDYKKFSARLNLIKEKVKNKQTLRKDEDDLSNAFDIRNMSPSGKKADDAIYFHSLYLVMLRWACGLTTSEDLVGMKKIVSLCPDDTHPGVNSRWCISGETNFELDKDILKVLEEYGIGEHMVYFESELKKNAPANCHCVFCRNTKCPLLASEAIEKLKKTGCDLVINFYPEYDGHEFKRCGGSIHPHFERIGRGMMHRQIQGEAIRICNVFSGKRTFIVIHEPLNEKEMPLVNE